MQVKTVAQKFKEAVEKLESFAGEDEILKKKLNDWISENFRMYEFRERITMAQRLRSRMDDLMKVTTEKLVMNTMRHMSHHGDLALLSTQTPEKEIELQAGVICFAAGLVSNEVEPVAIA